MNDFDTDKRRRNQQRILFWQRVDISEATCRSRPVRAQGCNCFLVLQVSRRAAVTGIIGRTPTHNAGISTAIPHGGLGSATSAAWHELHEVNVVAPFHLVALAESGLREAARRRRAGGMVNIGSHAGVRQKGASKPDVVSKAAVNHMTRLLALSLGPEIRVNAVALGLVDMGLTAEWTGAQALWP